MDGGTDGLSTEMTVQGVDRSECWIPVQKFVCLILETENPKVWEERHRTEFYRNLA